MITIADVILGKLSDAEINECIVTALHVSQHIIDRPDLHGRDGLERFINVLMGEVAEQMVLSWLQTSGKTARSAVDKSANKPDRGHDIIVVDIQGKELTCSVKSSLSIRYNVSGILENFRLATTPDELRDVNIQVYFWYTLNPPTREQSRVSVLSTNQSAIIGWYGRKDLMKFSQYNHEQRSAPIDTLHSARPMSDLLDHLQ